MSLAEKVVETVVRLDAWQNAMTGLGTLRDKLSYQKAVSSKRLADGELETLYTDDDICARIVEKLPSDAVRGGFNLKLDAEDNDEATSTSRDIVEAVEELDALRKLRQAWIWARLYGGGAVFIGADDGQEVFEPLDLERVRSIKFLNVLRRTQMQVVSYYDQVTEPHFGDPKLFRIVQLGAPQTNGSDSLLDVVVHESRFLHFRGVTTARLPVLSGDQWDDSVLQRVYGAIQQSSSAWMSVSHLMTDASQGVLKIENLMQMLSTGGEAMLRRRIQMMDLARSVCRAILVDANKESFERVSTSFVGIPDLLDRMMMRVAAAADMPVTELFGRSAAGMNATGEGDKRNWYDSVAAERTDKLQPKLKQLVRLVMATDDGPTQGKILDGWSIEFPELWQPTAAERATTFKTTADAITGLVNAQIALPEEGALKLVHDGWFVELDVASREAALKIELERLAKPPAPVDPNAPLPDPNADPDDPNADDPDDDSIAA